MKETIAVGLTVLAAAAIVEAALIPGLVIGGGAVLASAYVPGLRRRLPSLVTSAVRQATGLAAHVATSVTTSVTSATAGASTTADAQGGASPPGSRSSGRWPRPSPSASSSPPSTSPATSSSSACSGTAAGLSSFALVVGPLFYLAHEGAWNYLGPARRHRSDRRAWAAAAGDTPTRGFTMSRALAKTITFRTIATVMDFSVTYFVVRDLAIAAGLSAFGFVVGPFVYLVT